MPDGPYGLTPRELLILRMLANGASSREIARLHWMERNTVHDDIKNILLKMGVANQRDAVSAAHEAGIA